MNTSCRCWHPAAANTIRSSTRFEGVPSSESTVATQLAEITGQVAEQKAVEGWAATAARLRVAASVFGS